MPRGHRARAADKPEMMNIEKLEAQPEIAVELDAAVDEEEGEEYEETITINASDLGPYKIPWMICDLRLPI